MEPRGASAGGERWVGGALGHGAVAWDEMSWLRFPYCSQRMRLPLRPCLSVEPFGSIDMPVGVACAAKTPRLCLGPCACEWSMDAIR
jgi:hypothetical protein